MFIFLVFSLLSFSDSLPTSTVVPSSEFQYTPIGQAASWSDNRISGKTSSLSFYDHRSTIKTGRITVPDKHFNKSLASSSTVPLLRVNKKNTSNTKYSEENETVSASSGIFFSTFPRCKINKATEYIFHVVSFREWYPGSGY